MGDRKVAPAAGAAQTQRRRKGIIYVLKSGVPWRMLPKEVGCSGVTCWRCLRDWQQAVVWRRLRRLLLNKLGRLGLVDWSRASVDSASVPAKKG